MSEALMILGNTNLERQTALDAYAQSMAELYSRYESDPTAVAEAVDARIALLYGEAEQLWYKVGITVYPFKERKLYTLLDFNSWDDYCKSRFGKSDTSINNYVKPYEALVKVGEDPAEYKMVSAARARKAVSIVVEKKTKNEWTDEARKELITEATSTKRKPRGKKDRFTEMVEEAETFLAIESLKFRAFKLTFTQNELLNQALIEANSMAIEDDDNRPPKGGYPDEWLLEIVVTNFLEYKRLLDMAQGKTE